MLSTFVWDHIFPVLSIRSHICCSIYIMRRLSWIIKISWSGREVTYMNINYSYFFKLDDIHMEAKVCPKSWKITPKRAGKESEKDRQRNRRKVWQSAKHSPKKIWFNGGFSLEQGSIQSAHVGTHSTAPIFSQRVSLPQFNVNQHVSLQITKGMMFQL